MDAPVTQSQVTTQWKSIGTVVGTTGTAEFTFVLSAWQATLGDVVAVHTEIPVQGTSGRREICVWARVVEISRFNPFFPYEAGQEIANAGVALVDTVLSNSRDQLEARALILGASEVDEFSALRPLTYPVKPASHVYYPPANAVKALLVGQLRQETALKVGTLIARSDVDVHISGDKLASRHMAILAMTGGGKTVSARRIIRELARLHYPMLILDPHGDYIGLWKCQDFLHESKVKLFYPSVTLVSDGEDVIFQLISQMTAGMTEPQNEFLSGLVAANPCDDGDTALEYIRGLLEDVDTFTPPGGRNVHPGTRGAIRRALRIVMTRLERMEKSNARMRETLSGFEFSALPNAKAQPDEIVRPGQISVIYLGGYDHITQCSIAAITLETLFEHRANLSEKIPPFQTVIEEAHTFIPSAREGTADAVSLPIVRRMITEGRKFGTGLLLISQRPSRLDETTVSQCNSFLIMRLVNPRDQNFVRQIMENLTEADAKMIPGFGPGQGIVSGQVVRFPLAVRIQQDDELKGAEIGDEDFVARARSWKPDAGAKSRSESRKRFEAISRAVDQRKGSGKS